MFRESKKVKLPKKLNFAGDTLELEKQWTENGKACYVIRINNTYEGNKTAYAYAIDQDMRFIYWEGCPTN